ncbi:D-amino acid dehydrogenase [uncultured Aquitalea sp.]|uniref:D-amino acid dehydrogenase n=1 Tax=uncultured Aquitalea sp. TaxID=540272 RepID=UPI0025E13038|nr:D-amino acid dehydrogenase [uncultured Aquitalea sp.]
MKVVVLGAGVVGVSTAWFLAREGHEVEVVDRADGVGRETSFANGGQISVSQSEPWAQPGAPWKVLKWLLRDDAPLLFRPRLEPAQWRWCLQFLRECLPGRFQHNMSQMLALGLYSRQTLQDLRRELGLAYDQQTRGIVTLLRTLAEAREAERIARRMQAFGIDKQLITPDELARIEPALAAMAPQLSAATYCASDESGDVHLFTRQLAERAAGLGVRFRFNTRVNALESDGRQVAGVSITQPDGHFASLRADVYVLALGSHSPLLTAPLGLRLPIYPAKGYSATLAVREGAVAPLVSITDEANKIVVSRLGGRLRVAGTAELAGYSSSLNPVRCAALIRQARTLLPEAADWDAPEFWTGLRPATPGNVPLIGRSACPNLYLNTGHGTLGWTEGPGSGRALAELISGRRPEIPFSFLGV